MSTTPAVGYRHSLPVTDEHSLLDVELPTPTPGPHDLLVRVEAVSVNPVDVKQRAGSDPGGELKVLGYDAAGVVEAVGAAVTRFGPGDEVFYAGSIGRSGSNARLHLVDERITGPKPRNLDFAQAAAVPLTALTAWESLFDRLRLTEDSTGTILVVGAAGGVGSMLVQLAKRLTKLHVVGTASKPESSAWLKDLGADDVVPHSADGVENVDFVFSPHSKGNIETFARVLRPGGHVVAIDDDALDLTPLKSKSIAWHWELMFTRPLHEPESDAQHRILTRVAELIDEGSLRTTATTVLGPIGAASLREAHGLVESGRTVGKVVVSGW